MKVRHKFRNIDLLEAANPTVKTFAALELLIIIVSAIPGLIAYYIGGATGFGEVLKSSIPPEIIVNYSMIAAGIFGAVALSDWVVLKTTPLSNRIIWYVRTIFEQIGLGVITILRIGAALFFSMLILMRIDEPESLTADRFAFLCVFGVVMYGECVLFSFWHSKLNTYKRAKFQ